MDIETMPHAMYFTGNSDTVTKINQVPYQTIQYHENGMFTAKLMNDTPIEIFIDNGPHYFFFYLFICKPWVETQQYCQNCVFSAKHQ